MTKEEAVAMYDSKWWEGKTDEEIALLQLKEPLLCVPFGIFHKAMETLLGRPVWSHEFASSQRLIDEYEGKRQPPSSPLESLAEIIDK